MLLYCCARELEDCRWHAINLAKRYGSRRIGADAVEVKAIDAGLMTQSEAVADVAGLAGRNRALSEGRHQKKMGRELGAAPPHHQRLGANAELAQLT
jgi:hypothetical protein